MKKIKRLNQIKNDNIMNMNYVVDLVEYNDMLYKTIKAASTWKIMFHMKHMKGGE